MQSLRRMWTFNFEFRKLDPDFLSKIALLLYLGGFINESYLWH